MDAYKNENVLHVSVTNLEKFEELITRAYKEAHQLIETIDALRRFDISFSFEFPKGTA